jgi:hypothetical protein
VRRRDTPPPWLPTHWSSEQALAIFEFLQAVRGQLWDMYGEHAQQAWRDQLTPDNPLEPPDPNDAF